MKTSKEFRRLERDIRREKRRIDRLAALSRAAEESADAYVFVCARLRILDRELERAMHQNDECRAAELMREIKPLLAERDVRQRQEERLNERLRKLVEKLHKENKANV